MVFGENYYQAQEIFKVDSTGDQFFVTSRPVRLSDNAWEVTVRLIDDNYSSSIDLANYPEGTLTRFLGNAKPELHEFGFVKYQSKKTLLPCIVIYIEQPL